MQARLIASHWTLLQRDWINIKERGLYHIHIRASAPLLGL